MLVGLIPKDLLPVYASEAFALHSESASQFPVPSSAPSEKLDPRSTEILPVGAASSKIIESLAIEVDSLPAASLNFT